MQNFKDKRIVHNDGQSNETLPSNNRKDIYKFVALAVLFLLMLAVTAIFVPKLAELADETKQAQFKEYVTGLGIKGWFLFLGIQVAQVVFAFIPGELVEVVSGYIYGSLGGLFICLAGVLIGTVLIYYTVRTLGARFVEKIVSAKKYQKLLFLHETNKLELIIFILFFIPGTPKDILTYFVPLTPIKAGRFFLLSTIARIPSIISSTYAGHSISQGNFWISLLMFAVTGVIGILGIVYNNRIMDKLRPKQRIHKLKEDLKGYGRHKK